MFQDKVQQDGREKQKFAIFIIIMPEPFPSLQWLGWFGLCKESASKRTARR